MGRPPRHGLCADCIGRRDRRVPEPRHAGRGLDRPAGRHHAGRQPQSGRAAAAGGESLRARDQCAPAAPSRDLKRQAMRILSVTALSLLATSFSSPPLAGPSGPDDRQVTEPHAVMSASNAAAHALSIDDLYFTRSVSDATWSPDGKEIAFTTDLTGRPNLWKIHAAGGWPLQLVQSNQRQYGAAWSPDGKWIAYQQDLDGNELWDVYAVSSDGGEPVNLTRTPDVREESPRWSPDGKLIALNIKDKSATSYDLAILDFATRQVKKLTHEQAASHSWASAAW